MVMIQKVFQRLRLCLKLIIGCDFLLVTKSKNMQNPVQLISAIRQSFIGAEQVYTFGSCIMFYRILKVVYPNAKPYWSQTAKHCITRIGNKYYDITGEVEKTDDYKLDKDVWASLPLAVAFPQKREKRFRFTTPKKLY